MDKTSFVSRMKEKDQKAQLKMIEMRSKQLQSELYGLQSKPAINHHSKKIVRLMGDKYRGYQDGGRKDQQDTAPEELQCSFEPKINSRSKEKKRGVEELMRWNERKQKKIELEVQRKRKQEDMEVMEIKQWTNSIKAKDRTEKIEERLIREGVLQQRRKQAMLDKENLHVNMKRNMRFEPNQRNRKLNQLNNKLGKTQQIVLECPEIIKLNKDMNSTIDAYINDSENQNFLIDPSKADLKSNNFKNNEFNQRITRKELRQLKPQSILSHQTEPTIVNQNNSFSPLQDQIDLSKLQSSVERQDFCQKYINTKRDEHKNKRFYPIVQSAFELRKGTSKALYAKQPFNFTGQVIKANQEPKYKNDLSIINNNLDPSLTVTRMVTEFNTFDNRDELSAKHQHNRSVDDVVVKKEDLVPSLKSQKKVYYESLMAKVVKKANIVSNKKSQKQNIDNQDRFQFKTPTEMLRKE